MYMTGRKDHSTAIVLLSGGKKLIVSKSDRQLLTMLVDEYR